MLSRIICVNIVGHRAYIICWQNWHQIG